MNNYPIIVNVRDGPTLKDGLKYKKNIYRMDILFNVNSMSEL